MKFVVELTKSEYFPPKGYILLLTTEEYQAKIADIAKEFDETEYKDYGTRKTYSSEEFIIEAHGILKLTEDGGCEIPHNYKDYKYSYYGKYNIEELINHLEVLNIPLFYFTSDEYV